MNSLFKNKKLAKNLKASFSSSVLPFVSQFSFLNMFERKSKEELVGILMETENTIIKMGKKSSEKSVFSTIFEPKIVENGENEKESEQTLRFHPKVIENADVTQRRSLEAINMQSKGKIKDFVDVNKLETFFKISKQLEIISNDPKMAKTNFSLMKKMQFEEEFFGLMKNNFWYMFDDDTNMGRLLVTGIYGFIDTSRWPLKPQFYEKKITAFGNEADFSKVQNIELFLGCVQKIGPLQIHFFIPKIFMYTKRVFEHLQPKILKQDKPAFFASIWYFSSPFFQNVNDKNFRKETETFFNFLHDQIIVFGKNDSLELFPENKFHLNLFMNYLMFFANLKKAEILFDKTILQNLVDLATENVDLEKYSQQEVEALFSAMKDLSKLVDLKLYFQRLLLVRNLFLRSMEHTSLTNIRLIATDNNVFNYFYQQGLHPELKTTNQKLLKINFNQSNWEFVHEDLLNLMFFTRSYNNIIKKNRGDLKKSFYAWKEGFMLLASEIGELANQHTMSVYLKSGISYLSIFHRRQYGNTFFALMSGFLQKNRIFFVMNDENKALVAQFIKLLRIKFMNVRESILSLVGKTMNDLDFFKRETMFFRNLYDSIERVFVISVKAVMTKNDILIIRTCLDIFESVDVDFYKVFNEEMSKLIKYNYQPDQFANLEAKLQYFRLLIIFYRRSVCPDKKSKDEQAISEMEKEYVQAVLSLKHNLTSLFLYCYDLDYLFKGSQIPGLLLENIAQIAADEKRPLLILSNEDFTYKVQSFGNFKKQSYAGLEKIYLLMQKFETPDLFELCGQIQPLLLKYIRSNKDFSAVLTLQAVVEMGIKNTTLAQACLENVVSSFFGNVLLNEDIQRVVRIYTDKKLAKFLKKDSCFKNILRYFIQHDIKLETRNQKLALALLYMHFIHDSENLELFFMSRMFQVIGKPNDFILGFLYNEIKNSKINYDKISPFTIKSIHFHCFNAFLMKSWIELVNDSIEHMRLIECLDWFEFCFDNRVFYFPLFKHLLKERISMVQGDKTVLSKFVRMEVPHSFAIEFYSEIIGQGWLDELPAQDVFHVLFNMHTSMDYMLRKAGKKTKVVDSLVYARATHLFLKHAIEKDGMGLETWNPINQQHYYKSFDEIVPPVEQIFIINGFPINFLGLEVGRNLDLQHFFNLDFSTLSMENMEELLEKFRRYYLVRYYFTEVSRKYKFAEENINQFHYAFMALSNTYFLQTCRRSIKMQNQIKIPKNGKANFPISKLQTLVKNEKMAIPIPDIYANYEVTFDGKKELFEWSIGKMFVCIENGEGDQAFEQMDIVLNSQHRKDFLADSQKDYENDRYSYRSNRPKRESLIPAGKELELEEEEELEDLKQN